MIDYIPVSALVDISFKFPPPFQSIVLYFLMTVVALLSIIGVLLMINIYLGWSYGKLEFKIMLSPKKIKIRDLALCFFADFFSMGLAFHIDYIKQQNGLFQPSESGLMDKLSAGLASSEISVFMGFAAVVFMLALFEEFVFRGYLIKKAEEKNAAFSIIVLGTLLFGLGHEAFYPQLVSGIVYSWIFLKYRSILMTGLLHFSFNFILFRLMSADFKLFNDFFSGENRSYFGMGLILVGIIPLIIIVRETYQLVGKQDRFVSKIFSRKSFRSNDLI